MEETRVMNLDIERSSQGDGSIRFESTPYIEGGFGVGRGTVSFFWSKDVADGIDLLSEQISSFKFANAGDKAAAQRLAAHAKEAAEELKRQKRDRLQEIDDRIMAHPESQVQLSNASRRVLVVATTEALLFANPDMLV